MKSKLLGLMAALSTLAVLFGAGSAKASTVDISITDPTFTETFTLPVPYTPSSYVSGFYFYTGIIPVSGSYSSDGFDFINTGFRDGSIEDYFGHLEIYTAMLYSSPESSPTFLLGTYTGLNSVTGYTDTVKITATPLPAALPLFAGGLGGLGLLGWRRKRKAQAVTV